MTGKVYAKMLELEAHVQECGLPAAKRNEVLGLLRNRWEFMHSHMHSAGFVVDPEYQDSMQHTNEEVMEGFYIIVGKLCNEEEQCDDLT
jgi:hypothetical protein